MQRKILLVEDVEISRELMAELLRQSAEAEVLLAASVMEARRVLLWKKPDLVLLDEILPGESAIDLLNDLITAQIPTLLLTSMEEARLALTRPIPPGALGRIQKPSFEGNGGSSGDRAFLKSVQSYLQKS